MTVRKGCKMVVRPCSSKWEPRVWIPVGTEEVGISSFRASLLSHCMKENIFQRLLFLKNKVADTTVFYEEPNHMGEF